MLTTAVVEPTDLKRNPFYDKIYNVGLNTMFASIIPFLSLFYFNVYTVIGEWANHLTQLIRPVQPVKSAGNLLRTGQDL